MSKTDPLETLSNRIEQNLKAVRERIASAARRSGREPSAVTLVAVTKRQPVERVWPLIAAGARDLGENYPQELWRKVEELESAQPPVRWHLIGHLQSNKAKRTLSMVTMVHAVDSLKLLRAIDAMAGEMAAPPAVCLQVNTSAEEAKHGWSPESIFADAEAIAACKAIPIVGLMTMAAWGTDAETARPMFVTLREVRDKLSARTDLPLRELSMGMSGDFETAIEEGATLVRVGSALFEGLDE